MANGILIGALRAELSAAAAKLEQGLDRAAASVLRVQKQLNRTSRSLEKAGRQIQGVGSTLTVGVTAPLVAAGVAAVKFSTDFNDGMAEVATLIPGAADRVKTLKGEVQELAVAHGKDTTDLAKGLYQTISAFGDEAGQTVKILEINSKAAAAGLATTLESINLTSAVTKAFGDTSATAVQKVSDLAFTAVKLGQTTFPELAASMGRVAPIAATLRVSQEELFASFATLTGVTGNASEVSTQLSAVLRAMIKPTTGMQKAVKELGFSSAQAMVQQLGMKGALDALIGTTDGSTEAIGKLFGRAEALNAVFNLTGAQSEKFASSLTAMGSAAGATDQAFEEITDGIAKLSFVGKQIVARFKVLGQQLGDALAPSLLSAASAAQPLFAIVERLAAAFGNLPEPLRTVAVLLAAAAAAMGPVLFVVGGLITAVGAVVGAIGTLTPLLAGTGATMAAVAVVGKVLLAGMVGLVAPMLAVAAAFGVGLKAGQELRRMWEREMPGAIKALDSAFESLVGTWDLVTGRTKAQQEAFNKQAAATERARQFAIAFRRSQDAIAAQTEKATEGIREETAALKKQPPAIDDATKKTKEYADEVGKLADALSGKNMRAELEKLADAVKQAGGRITKAAKEDISEKVKKALAEGFEVPAALLRIHTGVTAKRAAEELSKRLRKEMAARAEQSGAALRDFMAAGAEGGGFVIPGLDDPAPVKAAGKQLDSLIESQEAFRAVQERIAKSMGLSLGEYLAKVAEAKRGTDDAAGATRDWGEVVQELGAQFSFLGDSVGGLFAQLAGGIAAFKSGVDKIDLGGKGLGGFFGKNILSNLTGGLQLAGAAVGVGKAIVDLFGKSPVEKATEQVGRRLGVQISEALAEKIAQDTERLGDEVAANLLNLGAIIEEAGGVEAFGVDKAIASARDLFSQIQTGKLSVQEAGAAFDEVFGQLVPNALDKTTGLASESFRELIALNDQFGTNSAAVAQFVSDQTQSVIGGLQAFVENASVTTQGGATGMANAVVAAFDQLRAQGVPAKEAIEQLSPIIEKLRADFEAAGFDGTAAFAALESQVALFTDEVAGPALEGIRGTTDVMVGLANQGLLTQETFQGLAGQIAATRDELIAQGKTGPEVMQAMQPDLQRIWQLQQDFGFAVDESTQMMLDQAEAAGLVGDQHRDAQERTAVAMEKTADIMERLARFLGVDIPDAARTGAKGVEDAFGGIKIPPVNVPVNVQGVDLSGVNLEGENIPGLRGGGADDFGSGELRELHGREVVMPADRPSGIVDELAERLSARMAGGGGAAAGGGGSVHRFEFGTGMSTVFEVLFEATRTGQLRIHKAALVEGS